MMPGKAFNTLEIQFFLPMLARVLQKSLIWLTLPRLAFIATPLMAK